jgi:hypothetical protein
MLRTMWLAAALAVACSGKPPPAAKPAEPPPPVAAAPADAAVDAGPLDQDLARLAQRSLVMYQDVAKAFAQSGEDCKAATARLGRLETEYRDVVTANAKVLQDGRAKELRAALDPHNDEFDSAARAVMQSPTMAKCSQDRAFTRAFDELLAAPP